VHVRMFTLSNVPTPLDTSWADRYLLCCSYYEIMKYYKAATEKEEKLTSACGPLPVRMAEVCSDGPTQSDALVVVG